MSRVLADGPSVSRPASAGVPSRELLEALVSGWCLAGVVPLALDAAEADPLASAGCFPGDLVRALMDVPGAFWGRFPLLYGRYQAVLRANAEARRSLPLEERVEFWAPLDPRAVRHRAPPAPADVPSAASRDVR